MKSVTDINRKTCSSDSSTTPTKYFTKDETEINHGITTNIVFTSCMILILFTLHSRK